MQSGRCTLLNPYFTRQPRIRGCPCARRFTKRDAFGLARMFSSRLSCAHTEVCARPFDLILMSSPNLPIHADAQLFALVNLRCFAAEPALQKGCLSADSCSKLGALRTHWSLNLKPSVSIAKTSRVTTARKQILPAFATLTSGRNSSECQHLNVNIIVCMRRQM